MSLNILIAPSGFKESLDVDQVAECIAEGIRRSMPEAVIRKAPLVDGGEGFTRGLVKATGGRLIELPVTGPVSDSVPSHFGFLGGPRESHTAVIEMAAAAGLRLVPTDRRDPLKTTTFGVGELIRAALDHGAERILFGCGDSGTNDAGAGMAQALGVRLLDRHGRSIGRGGEALLELDRIELEGRDPRLERVKIDVACNWQNVLCGEKGVARVFGPQKGASPATVERLEQALERFAAVVARDLGINVRALPGSGASGGLGAGLLALAGAELHPRFDIVLRYQEFDSLLDASDLVITAEGGIDHQTLRGKVPAEVARRAKARGLPVVAICGTIGVGAQQTLGHGLDSFTTILQTPCTLEQAIAAAPGLLVQAADRLMRMVMVGTRLSASAA